MTTTDAGGIAFLGLRFAPLDLEGVVRWTQAAMEGKRFRYCVTPNVDHMVRLHTAEREPWHAAFAAAERDADLIVNDSRILAMLAQLSGLHLPVVPGSDLTRLVVAAGVPAGTRVALIGGSRRDAEWLAMNLSGADVRHLQPPMGVARDPAARQAIADFLVDVRPALTLFAIGAPQSEMVARLVRLDGRVGGVGLCIGASIEFLTGAKRRAPRVLQRLRMEWAFRLASEPRRLWRRYLVEGPRIVAIWRRWRAEAKGGRS